MDIYVYRGKCETTTAKKKKQGEYIPNNNNKKKQAKASYEATHPPLTHT